ncbi:hypothetical protein NQ129_22975 [Priestia aryabhattai]|nr:hypothetical protein [Priestia aryabhattai]
MLRNFEGVIASYPKQQRRRIL